MEIFKLNNYYLIDFNHILYLLLVKFDKIILGLNWLYFKIKTDFSR